MGVAAAILDDSPVVLRQRHPAARASTFRRMDATVEAFLRGDIDADEMERELDRLLSYVVACLREPPRFLNVFEGLRNEFYPICERVAEGPDGD